MIKITKAAQAYFIKLLKNQEPETQIRIFVINPGTPSAKGGISYCSISNIETTDIALTFDKLSVYIDKFSAPFLENGEIDLVINGSNIQLTLKLPKTKIKNITNNTPLAERVKYIIKSQINPQLTNHGGKVSLVEITDDKYAILQFNGNCKGCPMRNLTLKESIGKQLMAIFSNELKGVKESTESY